MIVWITGAPGAGKTHTAKEFAKMFDGCVFLDGDDVRKWLTPDLGFTPEDRKANAQRVYDVAELVDGPVIVSLIAHPPGPVDLLVWVDGPNRRPLWEGTTYIPPEHPDVVVSTWPQKK